MEGRLNGVLGLALMACLHCAGPAAAQPRGEILDPQGQVLETLGPQGRPRDLDAATPGGAPILAPPAAGSQGSTGQVGFNCDAANDDPHRVERENQVGDRRVDACGRFSTSPGDQGPPTIGGGAAPTIDRMTTALWGRFHAGDGPIILMGGADAYELSDQTQWNSGAGSYYEYDAVLDHVEISGSTIRYVLSPPAQGLIYNQTDYNGGDHSAQGALAVTGPLVIEAQYGSTTATMRGNAVVSSNEPTWYGEPRFNYYTAIVGSVVPFEVVFTLSDATWTVRTFQRAFNYSSAGWVDFANPVFSPPAVELSLMGSSRIPDESSTLFRAQVRYASGVTRNVSASAVWSVEPSSIASVNEGVVTVGTLAGPEEALTLRATYSEGAANLQAEKQIRCLADLSAEVPGTWPMFQANARHTGALPIDLEPARFRLRWQRYVAGPYPLNPVAAGDGKVFVTPNTYFANETRVFALRALDGEALWSRDFGNIFSANPPSYAYGNVYVQTGNHSSDTWLHAFDGQTGEEIFKAPHDAQWERYFAPTVYDHKIYVNGGIYGGMFAFDAFSGDRLWFAGLPQYDQWTPAVDGDRVYAYVGEYTPGLYASERQSGTPTQFIADPNFSWNGWSMRSAPVIGSHDDVIGTHDGRLISFDTVTGTIARESQSTYDDQPSIADDRIFVIDNGSLIVLDEVTHDVLWTWIAPGDFLSGPMIVTNGHVLVSGQSHVYAVDRVTHQSVWSHPAGGYLALADDTLYIASADGTLTAISTPPDLIFATGFE